MHKTNGPLLTVFIILLSTYVSCEFDWLYIVDTQLCKLRNTRYQVCLIYVCPIFTEIPNCMISDEPFARTRVFCTTWYIFPCQGYRPVTPPDATRVCNTNQWLVGFDRVRVGVYLLQPTAVYLQQYGYLFFVSYVAVRRDPHPFFSGLPLGQSRCAMLASAPAGWCSTIQHWYGILVVSVKHVAYWPTCIMIRDHRESAPWQSR